MEATVSQNKIVFAFPEIHYHAVLEVDLMRTFRVPNDGKVHPSPTGFEAFTLASATKVNDKTRIELPLYRSDALWLKLTNKMGFPFAIQIDYDGRNAVTGKPYTEELIQGVCRTREGMVDLQNFLVSPAQTSLDGVCGQDGLVHQIISQETTNETKRASHRLKITVYPLKEALYQELLFKSRPQEIEGGSRWGTEYHDYSAKPENVKIGSGLISQTIACTDRHVDDWDMALAQTVIVDTMAMNAWLKKGDRVPPYQAYNRAMYERLGYPWFEWYEEPQAKEEVENTEAVEDKEELVAEPELPQDDETVTKVEEVDCAPGWWDQPTNEKEAATASTKVQPTHPKMPSIAPAQYPMPSVTSVNGGTFYGYPVASMPQLVKVQFIENAQKPEKKPQKKVSFWDRFFS